MKQGRNAWAALAAFAIGIVAGTSADAQSGRFEKQVRTDMTFRYGRLPSTPPCGHPCIDFVVAEGVIGMSSGFAYAITYKLLGERSVPVLLDLPGGNVLGMELLAGMFRRLGATVVIARARERACRPGDIRCTADDTLHNVKMYDVSAAKAECELACPFAFMGAKMRVVPVGAKIGLHAPELDLDQPIGRALVAIEPDIKTKATEDDEENYAAIAREMGIDPAIAARAVKTPHSKMDYLADEDVTRYRLRSVSLAESGLSPALIKALSPPPSKAKAAGTGALTPRQRP